MALTGLNLVMLLATVAILTTLAVALLQAGKKKSDKKKSDKKKSDKKKSDKKGKGKGPDKLPARQPVYVVDNDEVGDGKQAPSRGGAPAAFVKSLGFSPAQF